MSRIGKLPVSIPAKVEVNVDGPHVRVKGPLGQLERTFKGVRFDKDGDTVRVSAEGETRQHMALWGLGRTLLNNMVTGVATGFSKTLEINGVGYRAEVAGNSVAFALGYSHPVNFPVPQGLKIEVEKQTTVKVSGIDKELVGETAARIRALRPPEPYKGKGIKYSDEVIRRKAGKAAKK
ncbi:MAG: 50S ribosomal protein L6 [Deltaproteobacteria bacterium]|nr:50S ribosomal protein L6 [Deltaproteobacteria bacterium]MCB9787354.1 50S ribosomal protein L6 [Deltaproteobacteria bacterium]